MTKVTPCEAGYACPYCRQVDTLHTVASSPHCPIEWYPGHTNFVVDRYTGEIMPFVARTMPIKRKDDDYPLFPNEQIPRYERRHGNVVQTEPKNRL